MKTSSRVNKRIRNEKLDLKTVKGYYFHADEDFREDWDWAMGKGTVIKAASKPEKKLGT